MDRDEFFLIPYLLAVIVIFNKSFINSAALLKNYAIICIKIFLGVLFIFYIMYLYFSIIKKADFITVNGNCICTFISKIVKIELFLFYLIIYKKSILGKGKSGVMCLYYCL